ncbi:MAG: c-type cytochrome [Myxococcota bacterium]|jgi:DMSO reductase family type II enzyme heme b subunit|nr:c-type cytochrome [Myxococcota bacterium]
MMRGAKGGIGIIELLAITAGSIVVGAAAGAADLEAGRALYDDKCAQCHGLSGEGDGVAADALDPRPRDFTSGSFKIRTTPSGELPTDPDLASIIERGMPYTGMPAWDFLGDEAIANLVAYIQTFNEDFADPEMRVDPVEIPSPPAMTEESVEKGRQVFVENKCGECHGDQGRGDGESAPTLMTDAGIPIRPADMTKRWTFRGGSSRSDIYRTFTTGLDGTPMPSYADSIDEEQRWQLVDYVYSLSEDEPGYGSVVVAQPVEGPLSLDPGDGSFANAPVTRFPMLGQVTDPGRAFAPAVNAVEVRAVYNDEEVALLVSWHDIAGRREGSNRPNGRDAAPADAALSDAVAVQLPSKHGGTKPYMFYGDPANSVDLWFYEAGANEARVYLGRGEENLAPAPAGGDEIRAKGVYEDGRWQVVFVAPRGSGDAQRVPQETFVPIAFSVWSGLARESGNRRAISSWYHLYLAPPDTGEAYKAAGMMGLGALVAELLVVASVRRSQAGGQS